MNNFSDSNLLGTIPQTTKLLTLHLLTPVIPQLRCACFGFSTTNINRFKSSKQYRQKIVVNVISSTSLLNNCMSVIKTAEYLEFTVCFIKTFKKEFYTAICLFHIRHLFICFLINFWYKYVCNLVLTERRYYLVATLSQIYNWSGVMFIHITKFNSPSFTSFGFNMTRVFPK